MVFREGGFRPSFFVYVFLNGISTSTLLNN
jgi:hypothetical protein